MKLRTAFAACLLTFLAVEQVAAQESTRTGTIENAREIKAGHLQPDEVSPMERRLRALRDQKYLERITSGYNGFREKIGNMVTGGRFGIGPEYDREDLFRGNLTARASA